jgi:LmbE family N-acetylglucosaminyl deacetylase
MVAMVVSPHFDDAVFSCGAWIAANPGTVVCTIFGGTPEATLQTEWDRQCGFDDSREAMNERVYENKAAVAVLSAVPVHFPFLDAQYGMPPSETAVFTALTDAVKQHTVDILVMPLGLFHSDHDIVHRVCCRMLHEGPNTHVLAYEDALYRRMPGLVQQRLGQLNSLGITATPAFPPGTGPLERERTRSVKRKSVAAYQSQLRAFGPGGYQDVFEPERYWQLSAQSTGLSS